MSMGKKPKTREFQYIYGKIDSRQPFTGPRASTVEKGPQVNGVFQGPFAEPLGTTKRLAEKTGKDPSTFGTQPMPAPDRSSILMAGDQDRLNNVAPANDEQKRRKLIEGSVG